MPIAKKWSYFTLENAYGEGQIYGVYEIADRDGDIIYIGQGVLSDRLRSHFLSGAHPIPGAALYRVEPTGSKLRATQRERALLNDYLAAHNEDYPRHNKRYG